MGLFDRLFGKKKDTKEQIEEQEIAQVLEETSADESKEVVETELWQIIMLKKKRPKKL